MYVQRPHGQTTRQTDIYFKYFFDCSFSQRPARPSSARPAPPRVKRMEPREDSDVRIGSGKEKSAPAPVIVKDHGREEEEEEEEENTFIVEEIQQPDVVMVRDLFCLSVCLFVCLSVTI